MLDFLKRVGDNLKKSSGILGIASLFWLIIRTGFKPSRMLYPCQKAAATNSWVLLSPFILPFLSTLHKNRKRFFAVLAMIIIVIGMGFTLWKSPNREGQLLDLTLNSKSATVDPSSDIFVIKGSTEQNEGTKALIDLMGSKGLFFYQSDVRGGTKGINGLIARDDVVLIKVNCQWDERGGTNTDLLMELIKLIVDHPDGFIGEIIVADNGQSVNGGGSLDWSNSNAEIHSQSVQDVVDTFSNSFRISTSFWTLIRSNEVEKYISGDMNDGYVVSEMMDPDTGIRPSYPKFKTVFGTYVSFKEGIYDPSTKIYDREKLKVINVPVLKSHRIYGVTACVKHYMGVVSQPLTGAHSTVGRGGMGTEIVETRFPTLNILDAIWVNANPRSGPSTSYEEADKVGVISASVDPAALDFWAAKNILMQAATLKGVKDLSSMSPDNKASGSFGNWLELSMQEMIEAGFQVTMNENQMNIYVINIS
jgi:hypothetical protein